MSLFISDSLPTNMVLRNPVGFAAAAEAAKQVQKSSSEEHQDSSWIASIPCHIIVWNLVENRMTAYHSLTAPSKTILKL